MDQGKELPVESQGISPEQKKELKSTLGLLLLLFKNTPPRHDPTGEFSQAVRKWSEPPLPQEVLDTQIWAIREQKASPWLLDKLPELLMATVIYHEMDPEVFFEGASEQVERTMAEVVAERGITTH